ncbi:hypothetical protein AAFF_G00322790 [Aldrovandia affinis]|uniref:Uncharacterized protein n=1 Tax=Aldrovandia affinis TaxID=143900 RepID=A0AAD7SN54_9TELE|nr:hypothetical protein AAFF_G00322790 [Aldrovandia affinis]
MFSRKAVAGLIKPETLPPTEGAAAQHSLRAYLQSRDWMLLQSMSLDPSDYGWMVREQQSHVQYQRLWDNGPSIPVSERKKALCSRAD